jgi:hypothetical protein
MNKNTLNETVSNFLCNADKGYERLFQVLCKHKKLI